MTRNSSALYYLNVLTQDFFFLVASRSLELHLLYDLEFYKLTYMRELYACMHPHALSLPDSLKLHFVCCSLQHVSLSLFLFSIFFSNLISFFFLTQSVFFFSLILSFFGLKSFCFGPHESKTIDTRNRARTWWLILFPCVWSNSSGLKWLVAFDSGAC